MSFSKGDAAGEEAAAKKTFIELAADFVCGERLCFLKENTLTCREQEIFHSNSRRL